MGMTYTARLLKCDEPTPQTGKIYPTDEVKKAIEKYMESEHRLGEMGCGSNAIDFCNVSHKVVDTYVDDEGWWVAEIEVLGTPQGDILNTILESGVKPRISPRSVGSISCHSAYRVENLEIIALDISNT